MPEQNENTTTRTANTKEAGYAYIAKDKKERKMLKMKIGDRFLHAFSVEKTADANEKAPDYRVVEFIGENESKLVGAGWDGKTKAGRDKVTLKIGNAYYTAFMRDTVAGQSEKRADMTIFADQSTEA